MALTTSWEGEPKPPDVGAQELAGESRGKLGWNPGREHKLVQSGQAGSGHIPFANLFSNNSHGRLCGQSSSSGIGGGGADGQRMVGASWSWQRRR